MSQFPLKIEVPVAWGDMDSLGHVNNVIFLRWFESARIAYFSEVGLFEEGGKQCGPILASTSCQYRSPVVYPDTVCLEARVSRIGKRSLSMDYRVTSAQQGKVAAEGKGVIVWFDYIEEKSAPIPPVLRERIESFEAQAG